MSKRSGVDSTRISAKALLKKYKPVSGDAIIDIEGSEVGDLSGLETRSHGSTSVATRPENDQVLSTHAQNDADSASVRSSVVARHDEQRRLRFEEISLRREMENIERKKQDVIQDLERERERMLK
jgi:hypothetical protein